MIHVLVVVARNIKNAAQDNIYLISLNKALDFPRACFIAININYSIKDESHSNNRTKIEFINHEVVKIPSL